MKRRTAIPEMNALRSDENRIREVDLVLINVHVSDSESFDALLTRVPGLGEEIMREDRAYKVTRVRHERIDESGRARFGWHAFIDAELMPEID